MTVCGVGGGRVREGGRVTVCGVGSNRLRKSSPWCSS